MHKESIVERMERLIDIIVCELCQLHNGMDDKKKGEILKNMGRDRNLESIERKLDFLEGSLRKNRMRKHLEEFSNEHFN